MSRESRKAIERAKHIASLSPSEQRTYLEAERSGVPQGCLPSATGSADARAADEAGADSLGRSADKAVRRGQFASDAEIASHINAMMDELRWFYDHEITLQISPTDKGWSIKFKMADTSADAHSAA